CAPGSPASTSTTACARAGRACSTTSSTSPRAAAPPERSAPARAQASATRRKPLLPLASSAAVEERAATRYRLQYESWQRYEPPRITRTSPVREAALPVVQRSLHHSQTLPATSYSPKPLG